MCAAVWSKEFKEISSNIHMIPLRGASIDIFNPSLNGKPIGQHIQVCDINIPVLFRREEYEFNDLNI